MGRLERLLCLDESHQTRGIVARSSSGRVHLNLGILLQCQATGHEESGARHSQGTYFCLTKLSYNVVKSGQLHLIKRSP